MCNQSNDYSRPFFYRSLLLLFRLSNWIEPGVNGRQYLNCPNLHNRGGKEV